MPAPDDTPWLTSDERGAWLAVAALMVRLPAALDIQLERDSGLSMFEYMVLSVLSEEPDRTMRMSEIATFASSSLSRLSHTAKRLENAGYLIRRQIPGGGRRTNATLTDAGHAKVLAAAPAHVREVRRLLIDVLDPEEIDVLGRIGRKVVRAIDPDGGECDQVR
ncbi:MarR family transcriptional regulator [Gordonia pseudamarae]|jgi:DNA-binding MarR family transcriptional regulator|uniref:MarR family transcriptional regulator n=1 Tax=Gordonia pseudamarae TaxID=2831662 RepID=A0ABX6IE40_9ACTN|nr:MULTISPECIES: MarR family transcriptional regulator [Gordonia]MBD0021536.1 MarR family transcriptional regulator [Gordonia sp. (in: high G+C Gram-positive bacteria)]QHN25170.1 MarR family transcriptional regulator [Gordonia pseudamarae]QHN34102.1 MarR family transcriptional regulator [Gordonia pseudamarae]